ncbi:MAG: thioredoxin family protein [Gemmataceae bacterium]
MLPFSNFEQAVPYTTFFEKFGKPGEIDRWNRTRGLVKLTEAQTTTLKHFSRQVNILMLAGTWCGDCASQCPILEAFAEQAPKLNIRYLDRDAYPDAQLELKINGGNRVPVAVFFSEDGHEVHRFGERTLTTYRKLLQQATGEVCGSGIVSEGDPHFAGIVQDWLDEIERVQIILRLSPRLRRLHGD